MSYRRTFVTMENIDELIERVVGIVGDRRMTKAWRYIGEDGATVVKSGLTIQREAFKPIETWDRPDMGKGVHFSLKPGIEGFGISAYQHENPTIENAQKRYHHPEDQFLGQRRNLTVLETKGHPGEPGRDDMIRIEYWNDNGMGQETVIVFDDETPVHRIGDPLVDHYFYSMWCTTHEQHYEDPTHERLFDRYVSEAKGKTGKVETACESRPATLAEDLQALTYLAEKKEKQDV